MITYIELVIKDILDSILEAEKTADGIVKDAEIQVRKIEDKNHAEIEKLEEQANQQFLQKVEELQKEQSRELEGKLHSKVFTVSDKKIAEAVKYVVDEIINDAIGGVKKPSKQGGAS